MNPTRIIIVAASLLLVSVYGLALLAGITAFAQESAEQAGSTESTPPEAPTFEPDMTTANHAKFPILHRKFDDGPAVTRACLSCHTEAAKQIMQTSHWTWICPRAKEQLHTEDHPAVGKAEHVINNFCIALPSNEPRCTSCHAGYGWEDKSFDFTDPTRVDCLICHDQTGTYKKFPTAAGHPVYQGEFPEGREWPKGSGKKWKPVDLGKVARSVGKPTRRNCGTCHFFGGGGEGVKHGDMDVTLENPGHNLDVHMATDGLNFQCQDCHTTRSHKISGRCFTVPAFDERDFVMRGKEGNLLACESCHGNKPHPEERRITHNGETRKLSFTDVSRNSRLNAHTSKVSCEACHVPTMAPEKATKMWWDWSKAGEKTEDGKPLVRKGDVETAIGTETVSTYDTKKGEFIWAANVEPDYLWYNGQVRHTFMGDTVDDVTPAGEKCDHAHGRYDLIDEEKPVVLINRVETGYEDPTARIKPVKIHRGLQPYDTVNKTLVIPKLFPGNGDDKGEAYWKAYDWDRAIEAGMAYADLPYSGEFDWIQTEMIWPLSHMVRPAAEAVQCVECHTAGPDGRLHELDDFHLLGRDRNRNLDIFGVALICAAIAVSLIHGLARLAMRPKD